MFKRLLLCLVVLSLMAMPTLAQSDCSLVPQLVIGELAQVSPGQSNNVREEPSRNATKIGAIPAEGIVEVLDGPVCADALQWWQVRYQDLEGWTVEGNEGEYWITPILPPEPVEYTKEIAFARSGKGFQGIYHITLEDAVVEPLAGVGTIGRVSSMSWFPDGQALAYIYFGHGGEGTPGRLAIFSLEAQEQTIISDSPFMFTIGVSPDGKKIAYDSIGEAVSLLDLESSQSDMIINTEEKSFVAWSPDGKQIVTQTYNVPRITQIYSVDGSERPQTITAFSDLGIAIFEADWSPDGKYLAMTVIEPVEMGSNWRLVIYEIETERWFFITDLSLSVGEPDWSPDGSEIVFRARNQAGELSIYIYNLFDNHIEQLTSGIDTHDTQPAWRPVPGLVPIDIGFLFDELWEESQ